MLVQYLTFTLRPHHFFGRILLERRVLNFKECVLVVLREDTVLAACADGVSSPTMYQ